MDPLENLWGIKPLKMINIMGKMNIYTINTDRNSGTVRTFSLQLWVLLLRLRLKPTETQGWSGETAAEQHRFCQSCTKSHKNSNNNEDKMNTTELLAQYQQKSTKVHLQVQVALRRRS